MKNALRHLLIALVVFVVLNALAIVFGLGAGRVQPRGPFGDDCGAFPGVEPRKPVVYVCWFSHQNGPTAETVTEGPMARARFVSWAIGVAMVLLLVSRTLSAIGPAYIVVHGGDLHAPVVLRPAIGVLKFMWGGGTRYYDSQHGAPIPTGLDGRRYLNYDVYWGRFAPDELKPEEASQHGRLYLPTANQPAAVMLTPPNMHNPEPGATRVKPVPIPTDIKDFAFGRALTPSETAALMAAGVPMD